MAWSRWRIAESRWLTAMRLAAMASAVNVASTTTLLRPAASHAGAPQMLADKHVLSEPF
jgi:hypothetical protein